VQGLDAVAQGCARNCFQVASRQDKAAIWSQRGSDIDKVGQFGIVEACPEASDLAGVDDAACDGGVGSDTVAVVKTGVICQGSDYVWGVAATGAVTANEG